MAFTPKNRKEKWMRGIVDRTTTLTPRNREEVIIKDIITSLGEIQTALEEMQSAIQELQSMDDGGGGGEMGGY